MSFITIDKLNGSSGLTEATITVSEYQGLEDRTQSFKVVVDGKEVFVNVQQKAFVSKQIPKIINGQDFH